MRRLLATGLFAMWTLLAGVSAGFAVQPSEILPDPVLEKRARAISAELRCLVCQNQSIDDSDAPLAGDLRRLVRERLVAHDSDADVIDYIVARYGEFVFLKPRFELSTLLLWLTPVSCCWRASCSCRGRRPGLPGWPRAMLLRMRKRRSSPRSLPTTGASTGRGDSGRRPGARRSFDLGDYQQLR
jgi:cytochrome c-type biogenesis protein CcmH